MGDRMGGWALLVIFFILYCGGGVFYAWAHDYWDIERDYYGGPE